MYLVLNYFILHKLYLRFLRLTGGGGSLLTFLHAIQLCFRVGGGGEGGRGEAAHSASFYWVHKTLNLTHLHPLCCHRRVCLFLRRSKISICRKESNFVFIRLNTKNTNTCAPYWRVFQVWPVWRRLWCEITWLGCIIGYKLWILLEVDYILYKLCAVTDYSLVCKRLHVLLRWT